MSNAPFRHSYRVSYADCTIGNHVYYARYLDFLEIARGEFFRHIGAPMLELQRQQVIFPVIECRVRYLGAARYDDLLAIELWPSTLQSVRLNFSSRIVKDDGSAMLEAETFHACAGINEKPQRIPPELAERLKPHLRESVFASGRTRAET